MARLIPFAEYCGLQLLRFADGEAEIAVDFRDELSNSWGVMHGGVTMTLLDVVMAHAARSPLRRVGATPLPQPGDASVAADADASPSVVTIEMKTTFMRPGVGRLLAKGRLVHRTTSLAFCEGQVFDAEGKVVAQASGTFKYLRGLPVGGRRVQRVGASD